MCHNRKNKQNRHMCIFIIHRNHSPFSYCHVHLFRIFANCFYLFAINCNVCVFYNKKTKINIKRQIMVCPFYMLHRFHQFLFAVANHLCVIFWSATATARPISDRKKSKSWHTLIHMCNIVSKVKNRRIVLYANQFVIF